MALIEYETTPYDPAITDYFTPPALTTDVIWDLAAADLPVGPATAWPFRAGTVGAVSLAAVGTPPTVALAAQGYPRVDFNNNQLTYSVTSPEPLTTAATIYVVFTPAAAGIGTRQALIDFNGLFVTVETSGKLRLNGGTTTGGGGPVLTGDNRYVAAIVRQGNDWTVNMLSTFNAGTAVPGSINRIRLGVAGTSFPFVGSMLRAFACSTAHTIAQQSAQLAFLRNWYSAS